jgi:hypothetical protein
MAWFGVRVRLCLTLAAAAALSPACLLGQAFDASGQQPADNSSQKTEDWPGQINAYSTFAGELAGEDTAARNGAPLYRPDYGKLIGLTRDEDGAMRLTLVTADAKCTELASTFYEEYPKVMPDEDREQDTESGAAAASAKKMQVLTDLRSKQRLAMLNAINELKIQFGNDDFLRFDNWIRETFATKGPVHPHRAIHHTQAQ